MSKFYIDYNPYLAKCIFKKNNKKLSIQNKIGRKENSRLQYLLSPVPSENWAGLAEEIAKDCNYGEIELYFRGRDIDFNDLKEHINQYAGNAKFSLNAEQVHNDNDIEAQLTKIFSEIKSKNIPEFNKKINGKDIFDIYEEAQNRVFDIGVIATMSSGKSTLINSLLHTELLPSKNAACTATITRILNKDVSSYEAECLGTDNKTVIHQKETVTLEKLREYNDDPNISFIDIEGRIPSIPNGKMTLRLCDTPGPNNSMNKNHRALAETYIKDQNSIVLYILNACQLATNDDQALLESIASQMRMHGKEANDRFIFVVNKCDRVDPEIETYDKLYNDVISYLATFEIYNPTVVITSAYNALLIRKSINNTQLSYKEKGDLNNAIRTNENELFHIEKHIQMTPSVKAKLQKELDNYKTKGSAELEALIHTGIPVLELIIAEYIEKYAYPIKIYDSVKEICQILESINMKTKFEKSLAESTELFEKVQGQIKAAKKKHEDSRKIYDEYLAKLDKINFDSKIVKNFKNKIYNELGDITKQYHNKGYLIYELAINEVQKLERIFNDKRSEFENEIIITLEESIFNKCSLLFNEYSHKVTEILNGFELDGYDFTKNYSFSKFKFNNINDFINPCKEDILEKYLDYSDMKKNPERNGFIGFFKFWKDWKIPTEKVRKVGEKVAIFEVCVEMNGYLLDDIYANIDSMCDEAKAQVSLYKDSFKNNIHNLYSEIDKTLNEINTLTSESNTLAEKKDECEKLLKWINSIIDSINLLF